MSYSMRIETKHYKNSQSAQRLPQVHNIYTESSYISQIISHQQKLYDIPSSNKRLSNNITPLSNNNKDSKILQKNYIQNKYSLMLEGNNIQRIGWKKYLLEDFKNKIEKQIFQEKKANKLFQIKKSYFTKSLALKNPLVQDDYLSVNELLKKKDPTFDIEMVQNNLITKHKINLMKCEKTDYDKKLQELITEFQNIVDRIEKEAFKIKIPSNFHTAMQNYNDFYNVQLNSKEQFKVPKLIDFSKFALKQRFKQSYAEHFWEKDTSDIDSLPQIQSCRNTSNRDQINLIEQNQQFQSQIIIQYNDLKDVSIEKDQFEQNKEQNDEQNIKQEENQNKKEKSNKKKKNIRIKENNFQIQNKDISIEEKKQYYQQEIHQTCNSLTQFDQKLGNHKFVDYMLSLNDVYEANLEEYQQEKIQSEYDSFIFCDTDENIVYNSEIDWRTSLINIE